MTHDTAASAEYAFPFPEELLHSVQMSEELLNPEEARANIARFMVAKTFARGVRREGVLIDIARTKTKPIDFVRSVITLWGGEPDGPREKIDEIDVMYRAHRLGVFDDIFEAATDTDEETETTVEVEVEVDPDDEELFLLEEELQTTLED